MKLSIFVKPNAHRESVQKQADGTYQVALNAPPVEGRANERLTEILAEFFHVPKSAVTILRGRSGRKKLVEID